MASRLSSRKLSLRQIAHSTQETKKSVCMHGVPTGRARKSRSRCLEEGRTPPVGALKPKEARDYVKANEEGRLPRPTSTPPPPTETDFAKLQDGSLVELVEDPNNPAQILLGVWKEGNFEYTDRLEYGGEILVPVDKKGDILRRVRLPRGVRPYESVQSLLKDVKGLLDKCVVLSPPYSSVLANFALSTWLIDLLPTAPYVSVVGLPQSGKTTLLQALNLVCRRPLLTADITSAAFYDACARLMPTLLIDETGSHEKNNALRHLLRMGTTPGLIAMRKNRAFHAYGAKVISWLELPDDQALNSRCLLVPMVEANQVNLLKTTSRSLEEHSAELQAKLLQFRLASYGSFRLPSIKGAEKLRPRSRDLLTCLTAPCAQDTNLCQFLVQFFRQHELMLQEPLPPAQNAVLRALFFLAHQRMAPNTVFVLDFTKIVNELLEKAGEQTRLGPKKVGTVLTSLGFTNRLRTNRGYSTWLDSRDRQRVHQLVETHGMDRFPDPYSLTLCKGCPLCQKMQPIVTGGRRQSTSNLAIEGHHNIFFVGPEYE